MKRDKSDLGAELRAHRPRPRKEFLAALSDGVGRRPQQRSPLGRVGLALALTGLVVIAIGSFGAIGYASSTVSQSTKQTAAKQVPVVTHSAAQAQYKPYKPPKHKPPKHKPPKHEAGGKQNLASERHNVAGAQITKSELPFTGFDLWIPLASGLALIVLGLGLRKRGRRRDAATG